MEFLAFCLYAGKEFADCWPTLGTVWQLHAELSQGFAIHSHQWEPKLSFIHNAGRTGNSYTHQAHFSRALHAVQFTCKMDCMLNGGRPVSKSTDCHLWRFCGNSLRRLEQLCPVGKSCSSTVWSLALLLLTFLTSLNCTSHHSFSADNQISQQCIITCGSVLIVLKPSRYLDL